MTDIDYRDTADGVLAHLERHGIHPEIRAAATTELDRRAVERAVLACNFATMSDAGLVDHAEHADLNAVREAASAEIARRAAAAEARDALLLAMARRWCVHGLSTFKARNSDRLDFHEVSVWGLEAALRAAFEAGRQTERGEPTEALDQFPPALWGK